MLHGPLDWSECRQSNRGAQVKCKISVPVAVILAQSQWTRGLTASNYFTFAVSDASYTATRHAKWRQETLYLQHALLGVGIWKDPRTCWHAQSPRTCTWSLLCSRIRQWAATWVTDCEKTKFLLTKFLLRKVDQFCIIWITYILSLNKLKAFSFTRQSNWSLRQL